MIPTDVGELQRLIRENATWHGETFDLTMHRYMTQRFLAWVAASALVEELCLKGSVLLDVFHEGWHRHARCVDFLALVPADPGRLRDALEKVHGEDRRDGVTFDMASLRIDSGTSFRGRQTLHGYVTGHMCGMSQRVDFRIETGGRALPAYTDLAVRPVVSVVGQLGARLRSYTAETAMAERLESLYWRGTQACRFEDIADLFLLVESVSIDLARMSGAIVRTFMSLDLSPPASMPASLQPEFVTAAPTKLRWKQFVRREHIGKLIEHPKGSKPFFEGLSLEVVTGLLRERISRWLLEVATPTPLVASVAQAAARPDNLSLISTQQLSKFIAFHKMRQ